MKKFSINWKGSKKPKKQRKYLANAPLHIKRKLISVNLTKDLRKKYGMRNIPLRKDDKIKIMVGKHKGKKVKVTKIKTKKMKIYLEGIQNKKQDGSSSEIPFRPSNLQIVELNIEDKRRFKKMKMEAPKKEDKLSKNEKNINKTQGDIK